MGKILFNTKMVRVIKYVYLVEHVIKMNIWRV